VIGLPDEKWGERVHAVIVLHSGATLAEEDLHEWSKERLAGYKRPRSYAFIAEDDMPRNATGKVLHRELKKKYTS
jgi:fatty-acyl-CoA synthase